MNAIYMSKKNRRINTFLNILRDVEGDVSKSVRILDFGCGNGDIVSTYLDEGYDAYGCDVSFKDGQNVDRLRSARLIRLIEMSPYTIPFEDDTFDVVVSDQVFEHVRDYAAALKELSRVMKKDGIALHIFPSKYKLIEPHVHVPLATLFQWYWWLRIWAWFGIRKSGQREMSAGDVARMNYEYLISSTHYRSKRELVKEARKFFRDIKFCEAIFLKYSNRGKYVYWLSSILPFLPRIYGSFVSRVMLLKN